MTSEPEPKRLCFVIMPFSATATVTEKEWTDFYEQDIKPTVEAAGYQCRRSEALRGNFTKDILRDLQAAHLVIADLTDLNPNVFYELGVRHSLQLRTIMLTRAIDTLPTDLRSYAAPQYHFDTTVGSHQAFQKQLSDLLANVDGQPDKPDNPVADFLQTREIAVEQLNHEIELRQCRALNDEISVIRGMFQTARDYLLTSQRPWIPVPFMPAMEHVLATYSLDNPEFLTLIRMALMHLVNMEKLEARVFPDQETETRTAFHYLLVSDYHVYRLQRAAWRLTVHLQAGRPSAAFDSPPVVDRPALFRRMFDDWLEDSTARRGAVDRLYEAIDREALKEQATDASDPV